MTHNAADVDDDCWWLSASPSLWGSCVCGNVHYYLTDTPLVVHCCHCASCQRETGTAFAVNILLETTCVRVSQGSDYLESHRIPTSSGLGQLLVRCSSCATTLWSHYAFGKVGENVAFIRAGTLSRAVVPSVHIFTESKVPWLKLNKDIPQYTKYYRRSDVWTEASLNRLAAIPHNDVVSSGSGAPVRMKQSSSVSLLLHELLTLPCSEPGNVLGRGRSGSTSEPWMKRWWNDWCSTELFHSDACTTPFDRAVLGGFLSDRLAGCFAAGYQAALQALLQRDNSDYVLRAFCVSEKGGNRPNNIHTTLTRRLNGSWELNGHKSFVTGATFAQQLLVVARLHDDQKHTKAENKSQHVALRAVVVSCKMEGVEVRELHKQLPFVKELPHGTVTFKQVHIPASTAITPGDHLAHVGSAAVLPGDGYSDFSKPFRTIEDIHVRAATWSYALRLARAFDWPRTVVGKLLHLLASLRTCALSDPSSSALHIAVHSAFSDGDELFRQLKKDKVWDSVPQEVHHRWLADERLLDVASRARHSRYEAAWRSVSAPGDSSGTRRVAHASKL